MISPAINPAIIAPAWNAFQNALPIRIGVIHNEAEFEGAVAFINSLLDVVGDDEEHELADLLDLLGQLVADYENTRHAIPDAPPHEILRFLLDQHNLRQNDLAAQIGGQSVVSDILNGRRKINARQAKALAARFGISPTAFL